jgi:Leucine-rich repeat (LRR) protein
MLSLSVTGQVSDLSALGNLRAVDGVFSVLSSQLADFSGLTALERVDGTLYVALNPILTSLAGLNGLVSVRELSISDNQRLTSLSGLESLTDIEILRIQGNPALPQCEVEALSARLGVPCGTVDSPCAGNDDAASCN